MFFLVYCCNKTVSPSANSTHSVKKQEGGEWEGLTFFHTLELSSGNINFVIQRKKKCTSFNLVSIRFLYYSSYNSWSLFLS